MNWADDLKPGSTCIRQNPQWIPGDSKHGYNPPEREPLMKQPGYRLSVSIGLMALLAGFLLNREASAQSLSMSDLPGHERVQEAVQAIGKIRPVPVNEIHWAIGAGKLFFSSEGERRQVILATGEISPAADEPVRAKDDGPRSSGRREGGAGRAQQREWIASSDGKWKAEYRDFNVVLHSLDGDGKTVGEPVPITTTGTEKHRFGTACWVYGEELYQQDAMWFSPDSSKLAFYEIDESHMKTYFLTTRNTATYTSLHTEQYPTAGQDNPHVRLHIRDIASGKTIALSVDGPPDQYIYGIRFSADSSELIFHRTNRWQNVMDLMAANVSSGAIRTIVSETQETWQNNSPNMQFLADNQRFVWETEKTGWKQFELRHLDGRLLATLTPAAEYPVHQVVKIDEANGWFYYSAFSDENRLNLQLHRSRLDGTNQGVEPGQRLTPGSFHFSAFDISADNSYFTASRETFCDPPATVLFSTEGKQVATLAEASKSMFEENGVTPGELFSFTARDGKTTIYGRLQFPRNFDPSRKYPLLIDVYGGPSSSGVNNRFIAGNPWCEFGFIIAKIGNRGTQNMGKAFESATYLNLGITDLDDQADGVHHLATRPYVDGSRVGIYGHSYGGYMSALALLRYPDVFHVGVAGAPVTDWKNYDTIYTERYMRTPQENGQGYKAGSCVELAANLKGRLFLLHGLVDDNVHPSNTWQLADALHKAGKRFDMMIYPNSAHGFGYEELKWEYLIRHLKP
jgi:dipeptidyl-peptidase 4